MQDTQYHLPKLIQGPTIPPARDTHPTTTDEDEEFIMTFETHQKTVFSDLNRYLKVHLTIASI